MIIAKGVGYLELDGSPLPVGTINFDVAVTVRALQLINATVTMTKLNGIFDAFGTSVTLRNTTLNIGSTGKLIGTSMTVFGSTVSKEKKIKVCF